MKIFVSWSGEVSNKIAETFKKWLPRCIQTVDVFCSSIDIEKGENWNAKLTGELENTHFGIICLTEDNIVAPWLHFEAGALSKMLGSKVCAFATNIDIMDIKGPLTSFQACKFNKEDIKKLVQSINLSNDNKIDDTVLNDTFEAFWPQLEHEIKSILTPKKNSPVEKKSKFNQNEAIEELVQLTRGISGNMYLLNDLNERLVNFATYDRTMNFDSKMTSLYDFFKWFFVEIYEKLPIDLSQDFFDSAVALFDRITKDDKKWNYRFRNLSRKFNYIEEKQAEMLFDLEELNKD
ncbi:MAG: TIR domain-containing protein [Acholeplasmataceae bacterium]|jgi:hypothetical protein|nr:TIR domain-containing protein [Acholeplasmataceae bacterium]